MDRFSVTPNLFGLEINISKTELLDQPPPTWTTTMWNSYQWRSAGKLCLSSIWEVQLQKTPQTWKWNAECKLLPKPSVLSKRDCGLVMRSDDQLRWRCTTLQYYQHYFTRQSAWHCTDATYGSWQVCNWGTYAISWASDSKTRSLMWMYLKERRQCGGPNHCFSATMGGPCVEDARQLTPKSSFIWRAQCWQRKTGGQKLRYKDVLKRHMKNGAINDFTWQKQALDRRKWRCTLKKAIAEVEEKRRHSTVSHSNYNCPRCQRPCRSKAGLMAHMHSWQQLVIIGLDGLPKKKNC